MKTYLTLKSKKNIYLFGFNPKDITFSKAKVFRYINDKYIFNIALFGFIFLIAKESRRY